MELSSIAAADLGKALKIAEKIKDAVNELVREIYQYQKAKMLDRLQRGGQ
jgi:hypothetical protein